MKAWDLLDPDVTWKVANGYQIRMLGGRTLYDCASPARTHQTVVLSRLEEGEVFPQLRQVNRYVRWNSEVELVQIR